ncbi:MAG: hypothetical protein IIC75_01095 [Bacteroidetes bacterium]|nr:hypothetical protein [Bacteroidota bacterium]
MKMQDSLLPLKEFFKEYLAEGINNILQNGKINTFEFLERYGHKIEKWLFHVLSELMSSPYPISEYEKIDPISQQSDNLKIYKLPTAKLLGAHFRGISTIEGRRSAITLDMNAFRELKQVNPYFFNKVFLRLYFQLFRRRDTLNELWISRTEIEDEGILKVDFHWTEEFSDISLNISNKTTLTIGKNFCNLLLTNDIFNIYLDAVKEVTSSNGLNTKVGGHYQSANKIADQLTSDAMKIIEEDNLKKLLEARQIVFVDEIVSNKEVVNKLNNFFLLNSSNHQNNINSLRRIATALQGMLLYCRFAKCRYFYSLPYIKYINDSYNETASLTVMTTEEITQNFILNKKKICQCIFEPILDNVDKIRAIITSNLITDINNRTEEEKNKQNVFSTIDLRIKITNNLIKVISANILRKDNLRDLLPELCLLGSKLKNKKHEGLNLQFTFILAPVTTLGIQFKPLHLLGEKLISQLDLLKEFDMAKSIINGNFAFLQRDNVALFAPYPFGELVFTHMVDLDHHPVFLSDSLDSRENLLKAASKGKNVFIVATFKEGTAALFNDGDLIARTKIYGSEWEHFKKDTYDTFFSDLQELIANHLQKDYEDSSIELLTSVIRFISEAPNKGAVFIIGNLDKIRKSQYVRQMTEVFDIVEGKNLYEVRDRALFELAVQDGATIIDKNTLTLSGRWQITSIDPKKYKIINGNSVINILKEEGNDDFLHKTYEWGSRHLSTWASTFGDLKADRLNLKRKPVYANDVLAICISSDGPVHVFEKAKIKLDWPELT